MSRRHHSQQGFALIVVSALFIAFAIVATAFIDRTMATQQMAQQAQMRAQLSRISNAMIQYYLFHTDITTHKNIYPCPANPTDVPGNATYGSAVGSCYTNDNTNSPAHTFITGTSVGILNDPSYEIIRGMVPVNDLGLDPNDAIDPWGNKIMLVINRQLTTGGSGLASVLPTVKDNNTGEFYRKPDFIVISYGRDGLGAFPKNNTSIAISCPAAGTVLRQYNCGTGLNFWQSPPQTGTSVSNGNYFDDYLSFYGTGCIGNPTPVCS